MNEKKAFKYFEHCKSMMILISSKLMLCEQNSLLLSVHESLFLFIISESLGYLCFLKKSDNKKMEKRIFSLLLSLFASRSLK